MRFAHRVPLVDESAFFELCQSEGQALIAFPQENWTMMCLTHREAFGFHSVVALDLDDLGPLGRASMAARIGIGERIVRVIKLLTVKIGNSWIVNGMSPTQIFVVADYGERHT